MIEAIPPTKCHLIVSKSKLKKINKENASLLLKETVQIYLLIKEKYLYEYLEIVFRNKYKYIDIKKIFIYKESFLYITLLIYQKQIHSSIRLIENTNLKVDYILHQFLANGIRFIFGIFF